MFSGFSSFPAQLDHSSAAAAGLAVEPVLVAADTAAFAAAAGMARSIVAAAAVALALALAVAGMVEAAAYLAAEPVEIETAVAANRQNVVPCSDGRLAAGLGFATSVAAGRLFGLVSAADMNS